MSVIHYTTDVSGFVKIEMTDNEKLEQFKMGWANKRDFTGCNGVMDAHGSVIGDIIDVLLRRIDNADKMAEERERVYLVGVNDRVNLQILLRKIDAITAAALNAPVYNTLDSVKEMARRLRQFEACGKPIPITYGTPKVEETKLPEATSCHHTRRTLRGPCPHCGAIFDKDGKQSVKSQPSSANSWIDKLYSNYEPPA